MKITINKKEFDAKAGDEFYADNGDKCACGCGGEGMTKILRKKRCVHCGNWI